MKKITLILTLFTVLSQCLFCQTEEVESMSPEQEMQMKEMQEAMFSTEIEIDLSAMDFVMAAPNNYMSPSKNAMVSLSLAPKSMEEVQKEFSDANQELSKELRESFTVNGKNVLALYSKNTEPSDGKVYVMNLFCIENSATDCIMMTCFFAEEYESELGPALRNALKSVKLK